MTSLPELHLPERARQELGFVEVERILQQLCVTPFGRESLEAAVFPGTRAELDARMTAVLDAASLVDRRTAPDFGGIHDVRGALTEVSKDAVLGAFDLLDIARTLDALARLRALLESRAEDAPALFALAMDINDERPFVRRVFRSIDEQGQITDDASPTLAELRLRVRALRMEAQQRLEDLIREFDDAGFLRDRNFTLRHDRYVLPVRAELQGRVEGIVHDASQTGQTVFIEPRAILEVGNRIKIARAAALEEEARILGELTEEVRVRADDLLGDLEKAGELEALFARGMFSARIQACRPELIEPSLGRPTIELVGARHPLLCWMRESARLRGEHPGDVVANDIGFAKQRALIITGPNAGGKTVALKTIGLCTLLARAGMPIPASPKSRVPLAAAVLSTVGDQQSLDDALSSFSGHLVALQGIVEKTATHAERGLVLCLLDEVASGTDPAQGAALAQSVLEALVQAGALVVATTHYERLKLLALQDEIAPNPFRNASVALDPVSHRPTFTLHLDQVGTSNALDAARRYGLSEQIIERAETLLDSADRDVQNLLSQLAAQQGVLERRLADVEAERSKIDEQRSRLQRRLDDVEREAARLRREGAKAFQHELKEARRAVAHAIERIREGANAKELNQLSHALMQQEREASERAAPPTTQLNPVVEVKPGDQVEVVSLPGTKLEVLEVLDDEVVLARGPMKLRASLGDLRKSGTKTTERSATSTKTSPKDRSPLLPTLVSEPRSSENTLDVRGERVGEALELLDAFLDRLLREGRSRAFVLHGHGTGALKRAVRDALEGSRYASRFEAAPPDDGGDACTVIELADAKVLRSRPR